MQLWFGTMKDGRHATQRIELGEYIVADPEICHGKPTFKGTRIMVWQILDELAHGMAPDEIVKAWGGACAASGHCRKRATRPAFLTQRVRRIAPSQRSTRPGMILLDENIRQDQAIQLRRQRIAARFLVERLLGRAFKTPTLSHCCIG